MDLPVTAGTKLLYVEDDEGLARLIQKRMTRLGYQVDLAPDGAKGLAMAQTGDYEALLLDHDLPFLDGLKVVSGLAEQGALPATVMITGAGDERIAVQAMKLGVCEYVVKDPRGGYLEMIPSVLERAIKTHRLLEEKRRAQQELRDTLDDLERRVRHRTAELAAANERLLQEIAERERAQTELRQSEQLFRAIFETAQDGIFVKDTNLRYTQINASMERLEGLPAARLVGRTASEIFGTDLGNQLEEADRRVLQGEYLEQERTRLVDGTPATFHEIRVPLKDRSGRIVGLCGILRDISGLKKPDPVPFPDSAEIKSPIMRKTLETARLAAETDGVILLLGESGSGKDYLARYIHDHSRRSSGPFFAINCAAVAPELAESELFGHEPGAFTGAKGRKRGLLELAEGGTLLLNEVGELTMPLQAKLLAFLDTRSFTRVGGESSVRVNARLVAATNRDLHEEMAKGRFRQDLYYRLNVISIRVPPLRDRIEDLPFLVKTILDRLSSEMQLARPPEIESSTMEALTKYDWPGNVRELRNVLERAVILSDRSDRFVLRALGMNTPDRTEWSFNVPFPHGKTIQEAVDDVRRAILLETLNRSQGNRQSAAQMLGISRYALFRLMKTLDVDV